MYLGVCVLGILGLSVSMMHHHTEYPSFGTFYFTRSLYRRSDECNVCYGEVCVTLDQVRCDYYMETEALLRKDEDPKGCPNLQLRHDVDSIMFDIVVKELSDDMECIPYLSRYTDCDKENICIGCKICHCGSEGKWNCKSSVCRMLEPAEVIDHKVLSMVINNLLNDVKSGRQKRSMDKTNFTFSHEEDDEYYREDSLQKKTTYNMPEHLKLEDDTNTDVAIIAEHTSIATTKESSVTTESDYLAFDEVLNNIGIDDKKNTKRKSLLSATNKIIDVDYMLSDDNATTDHDNTGDNITEISYGANFISEEKAVSEPDLDEHRTTNILINLKKYAIDIIFNKTVFMNIIENKNNMLDFDTINNSVDYNTINLMKRDVSGALITTNAPYNVNKTNTDNITIKSTTEYMDKSNLKTNVLLPLIKIINSKEKESTELKKIKMNLITYMNSNNQSPFVEILDYPNVNETNMLHDIEMFPDLEYNLRRINPNIIDKLIYKLKVDIYEVIKDIAGLQKNRHGKLQDDLDMLIRALKQYVQGSKPSKTEFESKITFNKQYTRRFWAQNANKCMKLSFKQCVIEVLQILDKDIQKGNGVAPLSISSQKIIQNIIGTYYNDESDGIRFNGYDLSNKLANDLNTIGIKWQGIINNFIGNSSYNVLYRMKILHLYLQIDVNKISDALTLIYFAQNRRIIPYFYNVQNNGIEQINQELKTLYNKVPILLQYHVKKPESEHGQKKHSFIKRISNFLKSKSSKADVGELFQQQVPKSEIVRQLALKKLNDLTKKRYLEYETVMKKWQKALGIVPRYKRGLRNVLKSRIKSIIPKYLRHKVDPKVHEKIKDVKNKTENKKGK